MTASPDEAGIAATLVSARRDGRSLSGFPGHRPDDMAAAYRIQDTAIASWSDELVGWKIGFIAPDKRGPGDADRLVGPVWRRGCRQSNKATPIEVGVFGAGFAAVEAELVVRLMTDPPPAEHGRWTTDNLTGLSYELVIGMEVASSPIPAINDLGPTVIAADFGNNNGLVLGPVLGDLGSVGTLQCLVDGQQVGTGTAANLPGGLQHALATAWTVLAARGHKVRAGQLFATGAITGIHEVRPGQTCRVLVEGGPGIEVRIVDLAQRAG